MLELATDTKLIVSGAALGVAFGAALQRSHFCTMGCLADLLIFGSAHRLRVWALAIATALLGTQLLVQITVVQLSATLYAGPHLAWGPTSLGGLLFGFGMVLAGGCASRNLVRLATGSLKALVVLLVMASLALATGFGVLAPLRTGAVEPLATNLGKFGMEGQTLTDLLGFVSVLSLEDIRAWLTLAIGAALLSFSLGNRRFRSSSTDVLTGLVLGALVPIAWLATGWWAVDEFDPRTPHGLNFVGPTSQLYAAMLLGGASNAFGPSLVLGTVLGAFIVAARQGQLRLETFTARDDFLRHLAGGALMGTGGTMAMGCTIGQGLTGVATLGVGSLIALGSIGLGAAWAFRYLQRNPGGA